MKREEAELLKEKYYAATASPEEESRLTAFLRSEECPEEWAEERRALLALLSLEAQSLPEGFGRRLTKRLEQERKKSRRARIWRFTRIAAAAILLLIPLTWAVRLALLQPAEQVEIMAKSERENQIAPKPATPGHQDASGSHQAVPKIEPGTSGSHQAALGAKPGIPEALQANSSIDTEQQSALPKKKQKPRRKTSKPSSAPTLTAAEKLLAAQTPASQSPTAAASQSTATTVPITNAAPQAEKSTSDALPKGKSSLESQLERTLRSRDRLMAEARAYMASNCLDRRMPPLQTENTEP